MLIAVESTRGTISVNGLEAFMISSCCLIVREEVRFSNSVIIIKQRSFLKVWKRTIGWEAATECFFLGY